MLDRIRLGDRERNSRIGSGPTCSRDQIMLVTVVLASKIAAGLEVHFWTPLGPRVSSAMALFKRVACKFRRIIRVG